jgi:hypothetical protein
VYAFGVLLDARSVPGMLLDFAHFESFLGPWNVQFKPHCSHNLGMRAVG